MMCERIGHGGASRLERANTLASFDAALALGVDVIEFDVRAWHGQLVLAHTVAHAQAGEYKVERFEKMPSARRERWFDESRAGLFTASANLKALISFRQLNLMHAWPFKGPFDIIFCRNVVIYFDKETQRELFGRMADLQRDDDHLFIGHSESLFKVSERYQLIGKTIYRKVR